MQQQPVPSYGGTLKTYSSEDQGEKQRKFKQTKKIKSIVANSAIKDASQKACSKKKKNKEDKKQSC